MKVRLIDVANKANVSKSTASQYINGRYEYMSLETKERIRQAIEELNFVPNQLARSLKTEKTNTIGIVVSTISGPIFSQATRGIDDYCKKNGYNVLIYNTDFKEELEKKAIRSLNALRTDGIIVTSSGKITELLNSQNKDLPIVHIHRDFDDLQLNTVISDYTKGAFNATEYLVGLGHKRIAVITRPYADIPSRKDRLKGYTKALLNHNIECGDELIKIAKTPEDIPSIYTELMELKNPPSVIFTMYTHVTIDLLNYLNEVNISVPDDISIIAFDDLPLANLLKTPITAIKQSAYELGQNSAELLLNKINSPNKTFENIILPCELIIRSSCKNLNT